MVRSFSNRIFGGVCGGLASRSPFNATLWRGFFIALSIGTLGAGLAVYLLLWWLLPLDSPVRRVESGLKGLVAFLLSLVLILAWFLQGQLSAWLGANSFWGIASLFLALVFLFKQIRARQHGSVALGIVLLALPVVYLLGVSNSIGFGLYDLIQRALPALLVFFGLLVILRYRLPFAGFIALALTAAFAIGLASFAYTSRVDNPLADNQIPISASISPEITTLQIDLTALDTDVRVALNETGSREISAQFIGGQNSTIQESYQEEGSIATFRLTESQVHDFPLLEAVGRARVTLSLPPDIALALAFKGTSGTVDFDMAALNLERLNLQLERGEVLVTLPEYQPLSPSVIDNPGSWLVLEGNLSVVVPETVGIRFLLERSRNAEPRSPQHYDELFYVVELSPTDYILASRRYDALPVQVRYRVDVPNGTFRVLTESEAP